MAQPLIYIFALIVGALILIWGAKSVYDIMEKADTVNTIEQLDAIKHNVEIYAQYDKGNTKTIIASKFPSKVEMFCFYDAKSSLNPMLDSRKKSLTGLGYEGAVKSYIEHLPDKNFLILPEGIIRQAKTSYYVGPVRLKPEAGNPLCFKTKKKFRITAMGGYVTVEAV